MSKVPFSEARRKAGDVENPRPISSRTEPPPLPGNLVPKPSPNGHDTWLESLLDEDPPMSAVKVWRYLNQMCRLTSIRGHFNRCAWARMTTMGKVLGLSEACVRTKAIAWLVQHGWIAITTELVNGAKKRFYWALWLLPLNLAGHQADLGQGVKLEGTEQGDFEFATTTTAPKASRKKISNPIVPECAHFKSTKSSNQFNTGIKTTTTSGEVVVVLAARDGGEEPQPGPIPPAPPLPPKVAAALEAQEPEVQTEFSAPVRDWLTRHTPEWVTRAILQALHDLRRGKPIKSLAAYAGGMLANWQRQGFASTTYGPTTSGSPTAAPAKSFDEIVAEAQVQSSARAEVQAQSLAALEAERLELQARWDRLTPAQQREITERVKLASPGLFQFKKLFHRHCLDAMNQGNPSA